MDIEGAVERTCQQVIEDSYNTHHFSEAVKEVVDESIDDIDIPPSWEKRIRQIVNEELAKNNQGE